MPGARHLCLTAIAVAGSCAQAQTEVADYEIVPFAGARVGGEFSTDAGDVDVDSAGAFGLRLNARADANTQWQIYLARQSTALSSGGLFDGGDDLDVVVDTLQVGGTYHLDGETVTPYVAATLGATRFDPDESGFDSETFFAFSLAGGLTVFDSERLAVRLEARWLGALVESDSEIFCATGADNNVCLVNVEGEVLSQFDLTVGLALRF